MEEKDGLLGGRDLDNGDKNEMKSKNSLKVKVRQSKEKKTQKLNKEIIYGREFENKEFKIVWVFDTSGGIDNGRRTGGR